jgi:hypothetical protein
LPGDRWPQKEIVGRSRGAVSERPWHERALEPELVPEPAGDAPNFWPTMLRLATICAVAAAVAAGVVLLFNPKQPHKAAQVPPPPSALVDDKALAAADAVRIVPALANEKPAPAIAAPPQPLQPSQQNPPAAAPPVAIASATAPNPANAQMPGSAAVTPAEKANEPGPQVAEPQSASPETASKVPLASLPQPQPDTSVAVKQSAPTQSPVLDESEIQMLIKRGNALLKDGDFAAARLLFERAANAGSAEGALSLGSTYDPLVIKRLGAFTVRPDVETARNWYQVAADRGSAAAKLQLANLPQSR